MTETLSYEELQFSWDTVDGGSTPLMIDDGTTAYIYGDPLFGGTAPVEQIHLGDDYAQYLTSIPSGVQDVMSPTGAVQEEAAYSTYGVQTNESGGDPASSFGFQGSYEDPSGLLYLINRYYDPTTDQFISVDPDVSTTDQPYAFTGDDPLNSTDPLGLYCTRHHRCHRHVVHRRRHVVRRPRRRSMRSRIMASTPYSGVPAKLSTNPVSIDEGAITVTIKSDVTVAG